MKMAPLIIFLVGFLMSCTLFSDNSDMLGAYEFQGYATATPDQDRIKIPLEHRSINVGHDFTIEFWFKTGPGDNPGGTVNVNATDGTGWVLGHVILDRDIDDGLGSNDYGDWGIVMANGRIAFGVAKGASGKTIWAQGTNDLRDNQWHHVAVTRRSTGQMSIYVDGILGAQGMGPSGDVSYLSGRSTQQPNSDPYLVIAAEKHDYSGSLGYKGLLTGLRISNAVLYDGNFTPDKKTIRPIPYTTVALYYFNFWDGQELKDLSGNKNHGQIKRGGNPLSPIFVNDRPF